MTRTLVLDEQRTARDLRRHWAQQKPVRVTLTGRCVLR